MRPLKGASFPAKPDLSGAGISGAINRPAGWGNTKKHGQVSCLCFLHFENCFFINMASLTIPKLTLMKTFGLMLHNVGELHLA